MKNSQETNNYWYSTCSYNIEFNYQYVENISKNQRPGN